MRDLLLISLVLAACLGALRHPWIGVMLWTWLSLMNPHRYTYGFAYDAPLAQMAVLATFVGLLMTRDRRELPLKGTPAGLFVLFIVWMTASWLMGLDPGSDYEQWKKVMKINLMLLVTIAVLNDKKHIMALIWVSAGSLALLGAKGGVFTIMTGGAYRVWGPPGSFVEDNNEFALALVMTIPLLRFLQLQLTHKWGSRLMMVTMILRAGSALGGHARGGLLAIISMALVLWWRGRSRIVGGVVILVAGVVMVSLMPAEWFQRMETINTYQEDRSALGRFSAWWVAFGIGKSYLFGVGFSAARSFLFEAYSPYGLEFGTPVAHSIYFQVMGHHGFIGLVIFLSIWVASYLWAGRIRKEAKGIPEARWCIDLANMCQVSLVGYLVGGAFLSLAYFDLPYLIMVAVLLTRVWVRTKGWEREPVVVPSWRTIPGVIQPPGPGAAAPVRPGLP